MKTLRVASALLLVCIVVVGCASTAKRCEPFPTPKPELRDIGDGEMVLLSGELEEWRMERARWINAATRAGCPHE